MFKRIFLRICFGRPVRGEKLPEPGFREEGKHVDENSWYRELNVSRLYVDPTPKIRAREMMKMWGVKNK